MPPQLRDIQVSVVGLGLMGGSLAAALTTRRACRRVVGVARRKETIAQALDMGIIHSGTCDLTEGTSSADVMVLATPVRTIVQLIGVIAPLLSPGCLLTDVGSTKQAVVQAMQALPPSVQAVGGHPMCGKETAGLDAADPLLFEEATYVLTPPAQTSANALALALQLVEAIGARPLLLDAPRHDALVAAVSHLPYLLAVGLVATAENLSDDAIWDVAAGGFRDTSRLAASDERMMLDILLTNKQAVSQTFACFQKRLARLTHLLETGDKAGLYAIITAAAQRRRRLFQ
jgi:prephenate dehydrogenase